MLWVLTGLDALIIEAFEMISMMNCCGYEFTEIISPNNANMLQNLGVTRSVV